MTHGAKVSHTDSIDNALEALRGGQGADLLMVDVALPIGDLIAHLLSERISVPVVACGIGTDADAAVQAIKAGAKEYIPLPPDPELIAAVLEAVAEESRTLIFKDKSMASVLDLAKQVAPSNANILITGESGTGKEVLAHYIHDKSKRAEQPFISVNCAAIPENLLESELFGHEKGAFTGAVARRIGKFEEADGGTLLLDEISEMDIRLQAKLLRALQEKQIDRVGGSKPIDVNLRVVATSNRDLAAEVAKGNFREDLLYRLNVLHLKLPPLRERRADIPPLCEHFVAKYAEANGVEARPLATAAMDLLTAHSWKGNVRELENTMHRAVLLASGDEIDVDAIRLPDGSRPGEAADGATGEAGESTGGTGESPTLVGRTVADVERDLIIDTLSHCLGNRTHAANILGISIRTLRNKLKQYSQEGVNVPMPGEGLRPQF
jgi:DNA-binding NtrC family response regulator